MNAAEQAPKWVQQLDRLLTMKTQVVIHGNIYDRVPIVAPGAAAGGQFAYLNLREFLRRHLAARGYKSVVFHDPVDGLQFENKEARQAFDAAVASGSGPGGEAARPRTTAAPPEEPDLARDFSVIRKAMAQNRLATAVVIDFASRLVAAPERLPAEEREIFIRLVKCAGESARLRSGDAVLNNLTVLICDKLNDLPTWMYLHNPLLGSVAIDPPDEVERRDFFTRNRTMFPGAEIDAAESGRWLDAFVGGTSGLRHQDLLSLQVLSNSHQRPVKTERDIRALIDLYKFGVKENPWEVLDERRRQRFRDAAEVLRARVKGQERAIEAVVTVLKRAAMGLTGAQQAHSQKPRGVLFFAGPTGVGKTEMAKALAELVFNDPAACVRFDMSEYGTAHSDQKLMGAPPGYVGYQEGGQLTNRVRANPFTVLLFDEIEKADQSILDKFLQILEDGRMTDGRGETVYFSESVIIFTSNLGTFVPDEDSPGRRRPNVMPYRWRCTNDGCDGSRWEYEDGARCPACGEATRVREATPYEVVQKRMLQAIRDKFTKDIERPELLNRFGNNFVVFDYIRPEVMRQIVTMNLDRLRRDLLDRRKIVLEIDDAVTDQIVAQLECADNDMGARGVVNHIETLLVNPLAAALFDRNLGAGDRVIVTAVGAADSGAEAARGFKLRLL